MTSFEVQDPQFEGRVRASFERLALMQTIGARLLRVAPGEVEIDLPFRDDLTQHHGFLAAAALTAIADVACGYAAMTLLPHDTTVLTVEYKANFLAPARGQRMLARSRVVRSGRTVSVCTGDVFAEAGGQTTLVATMLATITGVGQTRREPEMAGADPITHQRSTVGRAEATHPRRGARRWCVCGGRGLGRAWRELAGIRQ